MEGDCTKHCLEDCEKVTFELFPVLRQEVEYGLNFLDNCVDLRARFENGTSHVCRHLDKKYERALQVATDHNIDPELL